MFEPASNFPVWLPPEFSTLGAPLTNSSGQGISMHVKNFIKFCLLYLNTWKCPWCFTFFYYESTSDRRCWVLVFQTGIHVISAQVCEVLLRAMQASQHEGRQFNDFNLTHQSRLVEDKVGDSTRRKWISEGEGSCGESATDRDSFCAHGTWRTNGLAISFPSTSGWRCHCHWWSCKGFSPSPMALCLGGTI